MGLFSIIEVQFWPWMWAHQYNVGDVLCLNQDYDWGLDKYPKGYTGVVISLEAGLMYNMLMSDGHEIGWSENILDKV